MSPYLDRSLGRLAASLGNPRSEGETVWWYEGWDAFTLERERRERERTVKLLSSWPGWY